MSKELDEEMHPDYPESEDEWKKAERGLIKIQEARDESFKQGYNKAKQEMIKEIRILMDKHNNELENFQVAITDLIWDWERGFKERLGEV